jgi:plastocyanin
VIVLISVVALGALISPAPARKPKAKTHSVSAMGSYPVFRWEPSTIEIKAGDRVVWKNKTSNEHHIKPYDGPWADREHLHLAEGGKATFRFAKPGTYLYYCDVTYHGQLLPGNICIGQCGEIVVG